MYIYIHIYCTTEEGDRVVEDFGCAIIVIKKLAELKFYLVFNTYIYLIIIPRIGYETMSQSS